MLQRLADTIVAHDRIHAPHLTIDNIPNKLNALKVTGSNKEEIQITQCADMSSLPLQGPS